MEQPLVSVLISAYNHEKYVAQTIQSIINQTYNNIELIIIDDGSSDNTWLQIQKMRAKCEKRFVRMVAKTQKNIGVALTSNELISLSMGKYIYSIASDDLAKSDSIAKQVSFLEAHNDYVLVVGDNEIINSDGMRIGWDKKRASVELSSAKYKTFAEFLNLSKKYDNFGTYAELIKGNHVPNGYLSLASALKKIPKFTIEAPLEDWYMHLQLSKLGKLGYINEVLFSYRWHQTNSIKEQENIHNNSLKTLYYEEKLVNELDDKTWKALYNQHVETVRIKLKIGNFLKWYQVSSIISKKEIIKIFGKEIRIR